MLLEYFTFFKWRLKLAWGLTVHNRPVFSFHSNYKLAHWFVSCGCISSIFLFSCLGFRNSKSKPTSRLVFDNVCLFFCSSINRLTDFCKAGKRRLLLQPLFSFSGQFSWDIIQTKNLNVLTFWQSCQHSKGHQCLFTKTYWEWNVSENPELWIKPCSCSPCLLFFKVNSRQQ